MFFRCGFGFNEGNAEHGVVTQRIGMREVSGSELGHDTLNTTWFLCCFSQTLQTNAEISTLVHDIDAYRIFWGADPEGV
jgi:hypothetical protein